MRKAKGIVTIVAGLVLLFQAGTTAAHADEGRDKANGKSDNKAQVSTNASSQASVSALGLQTFPSTSTGADLPLAGLGGVFISLGAWLLRRPARRNNS